MKLFKNFFALMVVALALVSCDDNDNDNNVIIPGPPVGIEVKYEVLVSTNMITQIRYRMGGGTIFNALPSPDSPTEWSKIMVALYTQMPVDASLEAQCINTTDIPQTCTLNLYKGAQLIETATATVAPADDDPETDDTVILSIFSAIHE